MCWGGNRQRDADGAYGVVHYSRFASGDSREGRDGFHESQITIQESPFPVLPIQLQKLHGRRIFQLDAQVAGDLAQAVVEMRQVIEGHVSNESMANFIIAGAAVQPS